MRLAIKSGGGGVKGGEERSLVSGLALTSGREKDKSSQGRYGAIGGSQNV